MRERCKAVEVRQRVRIYSGCRAAHRGAVSTRESSEEQLAREVDRLVAREADPEIINSGAEREGEARTRRQSRLQRDPAGVVVGRDRHSRAVEEEQRGVERRTAYGARREGARGGDPEDEQVRIVDPGDVPRDDREPGAIGRASGLRAAQGLTSVTYFIVGLAVKWTDCQEDGPCNPEERSNEFIAHII